MKETERCFANNKRYGRLNVDSRRIGKGEDLLHKENKIVCGGSFLDPDGVRKSFE